MAEKPLKCFRTDCDGMILMYECFTVQIEPFCYRNFAGRDLMEKSVYDVQLDRFRRQLPNIEIFPDFQLCTLQCLQKRIFHCFDEKQCGVVGMVEDYFEKTCFRLKTWLKNQSIDALQCLMKQPKTSKTTVTKDVKESGFSKLKL